MSMSNISEIAWTLNKTNWRIMAWYFDATVTWECGLRDFALLGQMSVQTTGSQTFTVYVYFRTNFYKPEIEKFWNDTK